MLVYQRVTRSRYVSFNVFSVLGVMLCYVYQLTGAPACDYQFIHFTQQRKIANLQIIYKLTMVIVNNRSVQDPLTSINCSSIYHKP